MKKLFQDLKVVELASVLAGPAVGMFFAELGASVVKIENKTTGGDVTRGWKLPTEAQDSPISAYFCSVNWGKQHLMLDLTQPSDQQQALQYIQDADLVISNFKPSAAQRFGLDAASLRAQFPRLIYAQLHAFADPEDESPAFDVVLQAEAGFLYMCGEPDRPPVKMPVALIDLLAAHQLKEAILVALYQRERSGQGATVSTSLMESALASLANQATNYLMNEQVAQRMGCSHPNIAPYGDTFTCADGQSILLAAGTERQFQNLCRVLHLDEIPHHPDFSSNTLRVKHRKELNKLLAAAMVQFPLEALMRECKAAGVPAARIRDMQSVFSMPAAQQMILEENVGGRSTKRMKTVAFNIE
ncbi:MAG: CoA transferase [Lewinellaceae bacterium]|nr:CoA transferase [Lewinellaceae bacterium]